MNKLLTFLTALPIFIISCKKDVQNNDVQNTFPNEPHLEFSNFSITKGIDLLGNYGDSINLTFHYSDGDSDLGRKMCDTCINDYGCIATFYKKDKMGFKLVAESGLFGNPRYLYIREIPEPNHEYYMGNITIKTNSLYDGDLQLNFFAFDVGNPYSIGDTLKITVQIIDKSKNRSNLIEIEKVYAY